MSSTLSLWMEESPRYEDAPITTPYRISTVRHDFPVIAGRISAEPQMRSRDNELRGNLSPTAGIVERYEPAGQITIGAYPNKLVPVFHLGGMVMTGTQGDGANEIQTLTTGGTVSGGTWTLTIEAISAAAVTGIPWNVTSVQLQALIDDMIRRGGTGYRLGDIVVGGGPFPGTPLTLTFQGGKAATNVTQSTVSAAGLTGSSPTITPTTTTAGSVGTVLLPDGRGLPPGAYRWVSTKKSGLTAKSARIMAAYEENAWWEVGSGFGATQISVGADGNAEASLIGLVAQPAVDPAITPSHDNPSAHMFLERDLIVTWRSGAGRVRALPWQISNPIAPERNRGTRSAFPGLLLYGDGFVTLSGTVEMADADPDDRTAHYEGDTFAALAHYQSRSKIGSSGARYEMFVDVPAAQITSGPGPEDLAAKRRFGASYGWMATYDQTTGKDFTITVTSALSAIETYV